jgi:hypothetical protein
MDRICRRGLYTAPQNPGIDGAVFLLGFERAIGSRPDR